MPEIAAPNAASAGAPLLTAAELDAVRRPFKAARLLPPRVFHDPAILDFEQLNWFGTDWICVGRAEEAANRGEYFLATVAGESVMVVRGADAELRAFHNVCRHRGSTILEESCGKVVRIQCPYHAWTYDLEGQLQRAKHTEDLIDFEPAENSLVPVRCETWQGFVFLSLDPAARALVQILDDLPGHFERFDFASLRRAKRITYEVNANWKAIAENYSECYHCPGIHPQLNRLTPYDMGRNYLTDGPWEGGYMELVANAETMSTDGHMHGRPPLPGIEGDDLQRIYYYLVWPNLLMSLHPDYLLTHQVIPIEPGRSVVHCDWFFHPDTIATPGFDPSDAVDFWDLTNRQDWHACELQQQGTASRGYSAGRYSNQEDSVHAFDLMCADRYADDGRSSVREVKESRRRGDAEAEGWQNEPLAHEATHGHDLGVHRTGSDARARGDARARADRATAGR
jgi:glycine betaine catabolism A